MKKNKIKPEHRSLNKYLKSLKPDDEQKQFIAELSEQWGRATDSQKKKIVENISSFPTFSSFSKGS